MPILSDNGILDALERQDLIIDPFDVNALQPSSIDLRLHPAIRRFVDDTEALDLNNLQPHTYLEENKEEQSFTLEAGETVLMSTLETVTLGTGIAAQVDGKSSLGRLFQSVHITAGWIDAGFSGQITLEVMNMLDRPVLYYPRMPIAQLVIYELATPATYPYSRKGHYQGQVGPIESRYKAFRKD